MNVAVVSHFVDDATDSGVLPETSPTMCSWIIAPSAATIRIIPPATPAERTRSASSASVASNASGSNALRAAVVVVTGAVDEAGTELDGATRSTERLPVPVPDVSQPASNSAHAADTAIRRNILIRDRNVGLVEELGDEEDQQCDADEDGRDDHERTEAPCPAIRRAIPGRLSREESSPLDCAGGRELTPPKALEQSCGVFGSQVTVDLG
jgi:hypothetical protein